MDQITSVSVYLNSHKSGFFGEHRRIREPADHIFNLSVGQLLRHLIRFGGRNG